MKKISRRQVLSMMGGTALGSALAFDPIRHIANNIVQGIIAQAQAIETTGQVRDFFYIHLLGGAARWYFDCPLFPYSNQQIISEFDNPYIKTAFRETGGSSYSDWLYKTVHLRGVNMPWMWGSTIPTSDGGWAPMELLLENMMMIRGVNQAVDGHQVNSEKQLRPMPNLPSLNGLVADHSKLAVPAVIMNGYNLVGIFKSETGSGQVAIGDPDSPFSEIAAAFNQSSAGMESFLERRTQMDLYINDALATLQQHVADRKPGYESLYGMRTIAESMLKTGISDAFDAYPVLRDKYLSLTVRSSDGNMALINDKPIPSESFHPSYTIQGPYRFVGTDMRKIFCKEPGALTRLNWFAEGMAVAEYLFTRKLSSSVSLISARTDFLDCLLGIEKVMGLDAAGNYTVEKPALKNRDWVSSIDEHFTGALNSFVFNTTNFRAVAACLHEFISVIKREARFDGMLIQLGGDFSRIPRVDGTGSDHGWSGAAVSLYSGAIKGPIVLGNIGYDTDPFYKSLWGKGAPVAVDGEGLPLALGHVTSTVSEILGVKTPTIFNQPLVSENADGTFTPEIELAKTFDPS